MCSRVATGQGLRDTYKYMQLEQRGNKKKWKKNGGGAAAAIRQKPSITANRPTLGFISFCLADNGRARLKLQSDRNVMSPLQNGINKCWVLTMLVHCQGTCNPRCWETSEICCQNIWTQGFFKHLRPVVWCSRIHKLWPLFGAYNSVSGHLKLLLVIQAPLRFPFFTRKPRFFYTPHTI